MKKHVCESCGAKIDTGGLFYRCRTEIISGFDNYIADPDENADKIIKDACKAMTGRAAEDLMNEVYEEITFLCCPLCRLKIREMLLAFKSRKTKSGKVLPFPSDPKEQK